MARGQFRHPPPSPQTQPVYRVLPPATISGTGAGTQAQASGVYVDAVRADSPVAYYRMGEASGDVVDSVGTAHGTVTGSVTRDATGLLNAGDDGAISFAGSGYFEAPFPASITNVWTIECWINKPAGSGWTTFFSSSDLAFSINLTSHELYAYVEVSSVFSIQAQSGTFDVTAGVHHVVWTRSGHSSVFAMNKLYVDGVDISQNTGLNGVANPDTATTFRVGEYIDGTESFLGTIDELAIYSTALSAARVLAHYNAAQPTGAGLETFTGSGAGTQAAQTASGAGDVAGVPVTGTGAGTQTTQSGSGSATETFTGTGAGTQAAQTSSGAALETFTGTGAGTGTASTSSGAGLETITGTGAGSQVVQSASGTGVGGIEETTGTGAGTQAAATASGSGLETISGTGAGTGTAASGTGSATETFTGTGAGTQAAQTASGSGSTLLAVTGTGAGVQAAQSGEGTGLQLQAVTGTGAGTQSHATAYGTGIGGVSTEQPPSHGHGPPLHAARVTGPAGDRTVYLRPVTGSGHGEQAAASAHGTGFVNDDELVLLLLEAA